MSSAQPVARPPTPAAGPSRAWRTVCRHINGVALGTTVATLAQAGFFRLVESPNGLSLSELATRLGARPGYLQCALRALAGQGWLRYDAPDGELTGVRLTGRGLLFAQRSSYYRRYSGSLLRAARHMDAFLFGDVDEEVDAEIRRLFERAVEGWGLRPAASIAHDDVDAEVADHLDGALIASAMWSLYVRGRIPPPAHLAGRRAIGELGGELAHPPSLDLFLRHMEQLGWIAQQGGRVVVGDDGLMAFACAGQYGYPLAYLPTLRQAGQILHGGDLSALGRDARGDEQHVDREHDIRFSGEVFSGKCKEAFFALLAPAFDAPDLERQPTAIVDTGSGDGTLLRETWRFVTESCRRGAFLDRRPLILVGVEPNRIARESTRRTLAEAGIPRHCVLDGDIDDPTALGSALQAEGLSADDCLHVSKSVVHNRPWREPASDDAFSAATSGVFVAPDGEALPPGRFASNLREWFERWLPWTRRHGMVVVEAHTVSPETAYANVERSLMTAVDITHGYSRQYLVEPEMFRAAATAAGYRILDARELGQDRVGHTTLTVHRFQPQESCHAT